MVATLPSASLPGSWLLLLLLLLLLMLLLLLLLLLLQGIPGSWVLSS